MAEKKVTEIVVPIDEFGAGKAPAFKGDGVAVWGSYTKDGRPYLSIKVLNSIQLAAFPNEKREK
jgi:hypothetical protein